MNPDDLTSTISTNFEGIDDAPRYAEGLRKVASAERALAKALEARAEAQKLGGDALPAAAAGLARLEGGSSGSSSGGSGRGKAPAWSPMERALRTMRFGAGKFSPLAGQTAEAVVGKEAAGLAFGAAAKLAGPVGAALMALDLVKKCGEEMYKLSEGAAHATSELTGIRAGTGASMGEAARLASLSGIGASGQGAASFKERISSDPQAMMQASRFGIFNLKGNFGPQDWAGQYLQAIERVSKIGNEAERLYTARTLGIEQEVSRYSLLSDNTKNALRASASFTGQVNGPEQERAAAEFQAAVALEKQARENLTSAIGQLFENDFTAFLKLMAALENGVALTIKNTSGFLKGAMKWSGGLLSMFMSSEDTAAALGLGTGSGSGSGALSANTRATIALTQGLDRLNGTIQGAGQRGNAALGNIRDAGAYGTREAISTGSMAWGTL